MKLTSLHEKVNKFLLESRCPHCGSQGAYVGLNEVECANRRCESFVDKNVNAEPTNPEDENWIPAVMPDGSVWEGTLNGKIFTPVQQSSSNNLDDLMHVDENNEVVVGNSDVPY